VALGAALERIHLFDRATGRRLEWVPDTADLPIVETGVPVSV
jgi:hypothetical protein